MRTPDYECASEPCRGVTHKRTRHAMCAKSRSHFVYVCVCVCSPRCEVVVAK